MQAPAGTQHCGWQVAPKVASVEGPSGPTCGPEGISSQCAVAVASAHQIAFELEMLPLKCCDLCSLK
eukprot:4027377-Prymnesium_polylepis.1